VKFTRAQIAAAQSESEDPWAFGNGVVYRVCKKYPSHKEVDIVIGKIWIIGRTYAAAVERRKIPASNQKVDVDSFYRNHVAPRLIASEIDLKLRRILQHREFSEDAVTPILDAHQHFMTVLRRLTGDNKRSLASKYLHFHAPRHVPIFDDGAETALARLTSSQKLRHAPSRFDHQYTRFVLLLLELRDQIEKEYGNRFSPRALDRLLRRHDASGR
jgi:hypothetical protein